MSTRPKAKDLHATVRQAVAGVVDLDRSLRQAHAEATRDLATLTSALEPREVLCRSAEQWVDTRRADVMTKESMNVALSFSRRMERVTRDDGSSAFEPGLSGQWMYSLGDGKPIDDLWCWLAPGAVKAGLVNAIMSGDFEPGPPLEARPPLIAAIEQRLAGIEAEHTDLVDAAADAGIVLELLPTVRQRREGEARQRQLNEERAASHAAEVAQGNRIHVGDRIGSEYLARD